MPVFTDMQEMLKATKPDGVIVTTPDAIHAQYVIAGLKAGVRVFTEKALCTTAAQCREILKVAKQTGSTCYTAHKRPLRRSLHNRARADQKRGPGRDPLDAVG